jgi:hypothetical protein
MHTLPGGRTFRPMVSDELENSRNTNFLILYVPGEKYQQPAPSPRKRRKSATERSPEVEEIQVITVNTTLTVTFLFA